MNFELEDVPGIGPTLSAAIRAAFPVQGALIDAIHSGDLRPLLDIEGLSEAKVTSLVGHVLGVRELDVVRNDGARVVFKAVRDDLLARAVTRFGRLTLSCLVPTRDKVERKRRKGLCDEAREFHGMLVQGSAGDTSRAIKRLRSLLARLERGRRGRGRVQVTDRVILVENRNTQASLSNLNGLIAAGNAVENLRLDQPRGQTLFHHFQQGNVCRGSQYIPLEHAPCPGRRQPCRSAQPLFS